MGHNAKANILLQKGTWIIIVAPLLLTFVCFMFEFFFSWLSIHLAECHQKSAFVGKHNLIEKSHLVVSDLHLSTLCGVSDVYKSMLFYFVRQKWNIDTTIIVGDVFHNVGGNSSKFDVTDYIYDLMGRRAKDVVQCNKNNLCIFIPGNHDIQLMTKTPKRWLRVFGDMSYIDKYSTLPSNLTFYAMQNGQEIKQEIPPKVNVDIIFRHSPRGITSFTNKASLIIEAHHHATFTHKINNTIHSILPAFNYIQSNLYDKTNQYVDNISFPKNDGKAGFGILKIVVDTNTAEYYVCHLLPRYIAYIFYGLVLLIFVRWSFTNPKQRHILTVCGIITIIIYLGTFFFH